MSSPSYHPASHVVFDLDGTLIDSEGYFTFAIRDLLGQYGREYDAAVRSKTVGLFITQSAPIIIDFCGLPLTPKEFVDQVLRIYRSYVEGKIDGKGVTMLPGALRLIQHLCDSGVPMAVCSASMKITYDFKVKPFGDIFLSNKYFHHILLGAADPEVKHNKPHPEPYEICIQRFNDSDLKPSDVLVFEDSPTGMYSAMSAGCQCILVPDPSIDLVKLQYPPTQLLASLLDFKPELFGLPPFPQDNV